MDLKEYLFHQNLSMTDFSKKIGYSRVHLSKVASGERKPSKRLAHAIEEETSGAVTILDLAANRKKQN